MSKRAQKEALINDLSEDYVHKRALLDVDTNSSDAAQNKNFDLIKMPTEKSVTKSAVSALQEFCAKKQVDAPRYDYIPDGSAFACDVEVLNFSAAGTGRSKRDAKHAAAGNAIKQLRIQFPNDDCLCQTFEETSADIPPKDQIILLRDYCVQHDIPLPDIQIVQQSGTPDAPEFTCCCKIASIKRYATSDKKKDARQKAAYEMLRVISDTNFIENGQLAELGGEMTIEDIEAERYVKFKTYRELIDSKTGDVPGVKLCDRHYYFTNFYQELKDKAFEVINSPQNYTGFREQALEVLNALKITPTISDIVMNTGVKELFIELNCDFDAVFVGKDPEVFQEIIDYFKVMLN